MIEAEEEWAKVDSNLFDRYQVKFGSLGMLQAPSDLTPERLNSLMSQVFASGSEIDYKKEGWWDTPPDTLV